VLWKKTTSELMQIKQKKPPGFKQVGLFKKVMKILECHHFVLYIRRFVFELFDKSVMRQIVLEEENSEEEISESDGGSEGKTERQRSISAVSEPVGLGLGL